MNHAARVVLEGNQRQILQQMRNELKQIMKTPRNAPCPCGARREDGKPKKFKHCCLAHCP